MGHKPFQTIRCPDCGLVLRVTDDTAVFKFSYNIKDWRRICTRVHLGDATWCLVQRDGTHPPVPAMTRREHGGKVGVDC